MGAPDIQTNRWPVMQHVDRHPKPGQRKGRKEDHQHDHPKLPPTRQPRRPENFYSDRAPSWPQKSAEKLNGQARPPNSRADLLSGKNPRPDQTRRLFRRQDMSDHQTLTHPQDSSRINLNDDSEIRYWTQELHISEERLRQLVHDHGITVEAIRSALGQDD